MVTSMKIVVISDTHGNAEIIRNIRLLNSNADMFLHLGDSELPDYLLDGFATVRGNCDHFIDAPYNRTIQTSYGNIYLEHGHQHTLNEDYIKSKNCLIFLSGHTHCQSLKKISNTYVANPGSPTRPRDGHYGSYLVIELDENKVDFFFKNC